MVLTPLAEELVQPVREVLLQIRRISTLKPYFDSKVSHKSINVVASDYACIVLLLPALARIAREAPNVKVHIIQIDYRWREMLERGDVDLAIIPERDANPNYPKERLFEDDFCCVACSENQKIGESLSLDQYLESKHAMMRFSLVPSKELENAVNRQSGREPEVGIVVPMFSLLPHAVVGTDFLATVQTRLASLCATYLPIKILPLPFHLPAIVEVMQYQPYQEADQGHVWFRNFLKEAALTL
jgi:DNA-binding transcriptional LysR family regulator